jgi:hypothetical protein
MWGALSDERRICRLQLQLALASAVILGYESRGTHDRILLRFETPYTWRDRSPYFYLPETGWVNYTPRQGVAFSSPPMTRRAAVNVFEPGSTPRKWLRTGRILRWTQPISGLYFIYASFQILDLFPSSEVRDLVTGTSPFQQAQETSILPLYNWKEKQIQFPKPQIMRNVQYIYIYIYIYIVAYLPHARKVEPQNRPFLSNTRTNNGRAGLRNPFLGYGSVNTFPRRRMTSHSSTGWESRDLSTARYSWRNNRTQFSMRGRRGGYITRLW